jgi:4-amino-4-deoxychorismate mutase
MSGLEPFRKRLDELDEEIARLLGERFDVCREIAEHKQANGIPMMQPQRVTQVRERYLARGAEVGLPADFAADLFELLIAATCKLEDELMLQAAGGLDGLARVEPPRSAPPRAEPPRAEPPRGARPDGGSPGAADAKGPR